LVSGIGVLGKNCFMTHFVSYLSLPIGDEKTPFCHFSAKMAVVILFILK